LLYSSGLLLEIKTLRRRNDSPDAHEQLNITENISWAQNMIQRLAICGGSVFGFNVETRQRAPGNNNDSADGVYIFRELN
jgi:hypothetical protein